MRMSTRRSAIAASRSRELSRPRPRAAPAQSSALPPSSSRAALGRDVVGQRRSSPRLAGARGSCSTRSGRRRASGSGRRRPRRSPAAPRAVPVAAVVPAAAAGGGLRLLPARRRSMPAALEHLDVLAHQHELGADDPVGQAAHGVQEGAEVELRRRRPADAGSSPSPCARARARAAASRRSSAAASCTCAGTARRHRARPSRPSPGCGSRCGPTIRRPRAIDASLGHRCDVCACVPFAPTPCPARPSGGGIYTPSAMSPPEGSGRARVPRDRENDYTARAAARRVEFVRERTGVVAGSM